MPLRAPEDDRIAEVAAQLTAGAQPVEILALTPDSELLAILHEATTEEQELWHATQREQTSELLLSGRVGVMVIDTLATGPECADFCDQLRAQFPDVILIVAGTTEDQTELVKYITAGDVYRFLHKPVSPPRARNAIDAAIRRHIEGRTITAAAAEPRQRPSRWPLYVGLGAATLLIAGVVTAFLLSDSDESDIPQVASSVAPRSIPAPTNASPPAVETTSGPAAVKSPEAEAPASPAPADEREQWLAAAQAALTAGKLTGADGESAAEYFQRVLTRYPDDPDAMAGLDAIADQLLTNAETALLEGRAADAERDVEAARTVRPNNMRLAFLTAQLGKERERTLIAQARAAAASGNYTRARGLLERAAQGQQPPSPAVQLARREIEQQRRGSTVDGLLLSAGERLKEGKLVEPAGDSAKSFIEAALAADPANAEALQVRGVLADQTLQKSRQALARRDFAAAESWLRHAESLGANVRSTKRELQAARSSSARIEQQTQLVALLNERITQSKLLTPPEDSAKHYWLELKSADPNNAQLPALLQALGIRLTQQAQVEFLGRRFDAAFATLAEAKALGYSSSELTQLEGRVAEERAHAAFLADVVPANTLARERYVEPRYPSGALRNGIEGWVEMDFTVTANGTVKDIEVRAAEPPGVFDAAAVKSVSQWRYSPLVRNGRAIDQRARLRMRFALMRE
jgi:protein TonB